VREHEDTVRIPDEQIRLPVAGQMTDRDVPGVRQRIGIARRRDPPPSLKNNVAQVSGSDGHRPGQYFCRLPVTSDLLATWVGMSQTVSMPVSQPAAGNLRTPPEFVAWVAELVHRHRARLVTYARRRGATPADAFDIVQDTFASFLTLPEARSIAHVGDDAVKLLTVIARHNILNRRRKLARHDTWPDLDVIDALPSPDTESSVDLLLHAERLARAYGCLQRMSRLHRAAVLLSTLDEQPGEDVATSLGVSPGHVRVLLHRARAHVRACPLEEMPSLSARELRDSLAGS
jgi:RNA polymerase sigma-70 factor, ECF subfamily